MLKKQNNLYDTNLDEIEYAFFCDFLEEQYEEAKEVGVFINDEDYYYKYQLETFLYFTDKTYKIKTTLVKQ